jgi:hypothetical protein
VAVRTEERRERMNGLGKRETETGWLNCSWNFVTGRSVDSVIVPSSAHWAVLPSATLGSYTTPNVVFLPFNQGPGPDTLPHFEPLHRVVPSSCLVSSDPAVPYIRHNLCLCETRTLYCLPEIGMLASHLILDRAAFGPANPSFSVS